MGYRHSLVSANRHPSLSERCRLRLAQRLQLVSTNTISTAFLPCRTSAPKSAGVVSGMGAKFPEKYQRAIFASDWTYAPCGPLHLTPSGGTFKAQREEFMWASRCSHRRHRPPGRRHVCRRRGRRTQSGLYRVTYVGKESTAPVKPLVASPEFALAANSRSCTITAPDRRPSRKLPHLASKDRNVRYAARVAIERQACRQVAEKSFHREGPSAKLEAGSPGTREPCPGHGSHGNESKTRCPAPPTGRDGYPAETGRAGRTSCCRCSPLGLQNFPRPRASAPAPAGLRTVFTRLGKPAPEVWREGRCPAGGPLPPQGQHGKRELCQFSFVDSKSSSPKTIASWPLRRTTGRPSPGDAVLARKRRLCPRRERRVLSRPNKQQIA